MFVAEDLSKGGILLVHRKEESLQADREIGIAVKLG
jgi:hypothetical protein